jgi:hypothetical protein
MRGVARAEGDADWATAKDADEDDPRSYPAARSPLGEAIVYSPQWLRVSER